VRHLRIGLALVALMAFCVFVVASVGGGHHKSSTATTAPTAPSSARPSPTPTRATTSECSTPGVDSYRSVPDPQAVGGSRKIWIHRPAGPDSAKLPVLYLLLDQGQSDRSAVQLQLGRILDRQMCQTGIPFVVAVPDGRTTSAPQPDWGNDVNGKFGLEHFVTTTVIRQVEGDQRRSARLRAISGFGMGGFGATSIALRHPSLYSQVASFGGWYRVDDPDGVFGGHNSAHAPDQLIDSAKPGSLRFFLVEGKDEATPLQYGTVHGEANRFGALVLQHGFTVEVRHPAGGHDRKTFLPQLPGMVRFLDHNWTSAKTRVAG
jgi:S-formylglutathione hydrolase FrmB